MVEIDIGDVCRRYGASVLRRCRAMLRDPDEAEDAAQEVFVTVMAKAAQLSNEAATAAWIYRITTNLCLNRLRGNQRRAGRERSQSVVDWPEAARSDPYERYAAKRVLSTVLGKLDPLGQAIFVYRHLDGMTQNEIAAATHTSRRTIGKRLKKIDALVSAATQEQA